MKVKLSPRQLAEQLPELRLDILQTYENDLVIEGREFGKEEPRAYDMPDPPTPQDGGMAQIFPILQVDARLSKFFTSKELTILNCIHTREYTMIQLAVVVMGGDGIRECNNIAVHLKNIRRKCENQSIGWRLNEMHTRPRFYRLEKR